jgi:hypothetical protein
MSYYSKLNMYCNSPRIIVDPSLSASPKPPLPLSDCKSSVCTCRSTFSKENFEQTPSLTLKWTTKESVSTATPEINGPPFWFILHNGTAHLPEQISPISLQRLRGFIDGIPEMQPCTECSEHARAYIDKNKEKILALKTGDDFFRFFVDFHNVVNQRLGKKIVSYNEAYLMYKYGKNVKVLTY